MISFKNKIIFKITSLENPYLTKICTFLDEDISLRNFQFCLGFSKTLGEIFKNVEIILPKLFHSFHFYSSDYDCKILESFFNSTSNIKEISFYKRVQKSVNLVIFEYIKRSKSLLSLTLLFCSFSNDDDIFYFNSALKENNSITILDISYC